MERPERVPVQQPEQPGGIEDGCLRDDRAAVLVRRHLELQPGAAGYLHLGAEPQQPVLLERLDAPEIDRIAHPEACRVTAAPAQSRAADENIEQAAQPPQERPLVPAVVTTDRLDRDERALRWGGDCE